MEIKIAVVVQDCKITIMKINESSIDYAKLSSTIREFYDFSFFLYKKRDLNRKF